MDKDYSSAMEISLGQHLRELPGPLLLTGHSGFKGTWMTLLFEHLGVPVIGYSLEPEKDSLFDRAKRIGSIPEKFADIRDYKELENFIDLHRPSTIIHMAAQPLVLESYINPRETFDINVMGTANVLDIAFRKDFIKAIVIVTTDKVYRNDNSGREFIESDPLEGKDPYSASKVGTEAVVAAWQQISRTSGGPKVVSVRAGNVIGGGDFAANRIIPDLIRGIIKGETVEIRSPNSTRPWQHVLDPLHGYIKVLERLVLGSDIVCLNFGPTDKSLHVSELVRIGIAHFPALSDLTSNNTKTESDLESISLGLNPGKSIAELDWKPKWDQVESIRKTFTWWKKVLEEESIPKTICIQNIEEFLTQD
jgi:CDP-glucose 4,6-dehydratase